MKKEEFKVLDVLKEISNESSKNGKMDILKQHFDNKTLQQLLVYIFDPYKVYGIGSKAFVKKYQKTSETEFDSIFGLFDYLLENKTGTDETKCKVNSFLLAQPSEYQDLVKKIILKNPTIGITSKTVNKVWEELVPTFDVMLAEPFERLHEEVAVELKYDGVRATGVKTNGKTTLFTRNGKEIEGFNSIIEQLNSLPINNVVFDGELISNNSYKETMEKLSKKTDNKEADYMIFDMLPFDEFNKGKSELAYSERRTVLVELSNEFFDNFENLKLAPILVLLQKPTEESLVHYTNLAVSEGFEGVMVKDMKGFYHTKRTFDWQKLKPFEDGDYEIIRIEEGQGRNVGRMGKVIIDVDGVEVGLGTGWTDEERINMWDNPNKYIGQIVEVQYQEKIKKTGSLRFPSVKGIRWDK